MSTLQYFGTMLLNGFIVAFIVFSALWIIQVIRKDAGVVDIGWTAGVGAMAVYAAIIGEGWLPRRILLGAMGAEIFGAGSDRGVHRIEGQGCRAHRPRDEVRPRPGFGTHCKCRSLRTVM